MRASESWALAVGRRRTQQRAQANSKAAKQDITPCPIARLSVHTTKAGGTLPRRTQWEARVLATVRSQGVPRGLCSNPLKGTRKKDDMNTMMSGIFGRGLEECNVRRLCRARLKRKSAARKVALPSSQSIPELPLGIRPCWQQQAHRLCPRCLVARVREQPQ